MTDRTLYRGDHYVLRRQVYVIELVDDNLEPFDMSGCSIRSTFKLEPTNPIEDPDDVTAVLRCDITFDESGDVVESHNFMLPTGGDVADGVLWLVADDEATMALPTGESWSSDVQVTDMNGEHLTIPMVGKLQAIDGYTNRTTKGA